MAGAETTPTSLMSITNDVETQHLSATEEGTVVVQDTITGQHRSYVYLSPEMATGIQFNQDGIPMMRDDGTTDCNSAPGTDSESGPAMVEIIVPTSGLEMTECNPGGEAIFIRDLPNEMSCAEANFPVEGQKQEADNITSAPEEQQSVTGLGQDVASHQPLADTGSALNGANDLVQTQDTDGACNVIQSHQIPIDALHLVDTAQEEPQIEQQTEDATDKMQTDGVQPGDSGDTTSANISQQQSDIQVKDEKKGAQDFLFVCVHGQTFRCKRQAGIPIETPPQEEPSNACACNKFKTSATCHAADVKCDKPVRKLRNRKQVFSCDQCDETFTQRASLEHHKASHDDDEEEESEEVEKSPVKITKNQKSPSGRLQRRTRQQKREEKLCPDCCKVFYSDKALEMHKRWHEKQKCKNLQSDDGEKSKKKDDKVRNLSCTICQKTFTRMYDVERHMETHVDGDRRKCGSCGKSFQTIKSRERHETLHCDSKKQNKCNTCDVVFGSKFKLLRHEREHLTSEQIENLSCKTCLKVFTNANSLLRHDKLHLKEQGALIRCAHCPETFEDRFSYNTHKKSHIVKAYQCDLCGMKFKHEYLMNIHLKRKTCQKKRESLRDVECKLCQKVVKGTATLKRHMRTHTKEKPYPCRIGCGSSFSSTSNRLSHERMYCKMSPSYLCPHCGEVLSNQARLIYHESKYHGIGPVVGGHRTQTTEFPCRYCGKVFFFKGGRKRHERIHTDEKPYMCQFCPKAFVHASALVCHERVHTKARPYKCEECGKAFSQATHLKTHIRVHTKEKPYKCRVCLKAFSHMGTRKSHEGTHKNIHVDPEMQADVPMVQSTNEFHIPQQDHQGIPTEIKVVHHEVPVPHKVHVSHHEHEVQAADVILQLLESGSRSNFDGFVHIASS